jgi:pimeloyl-ACP methyl ester carboxylesterase
MRVELTTPGLRLVEHEFSVPLDHADLDGERVTIFAREVADLDGLDRPLLLYLQGGPGYEAPRPARNPSGPGWLDRALQDFRVLMLDQRGTGRSSPLGTSSELEPAALAARLTHFRADAIVRDAEWIRDAMDVDRWSVLGQSFGGMCVVSYLSLAPEGLREAFVTGGLAPLGARIDDVYRATFARTIDGSRRYFERYPADRDRVLALHERLEASDLRLPSGDRLTARRLRQLGGLLGLSTGAERLHYVLELAADSPAFGHDVVSETAFARNPIYAILHEACWADGESTRWSAQRMQPADYETEPELFTGEHVFRWMFDEYTALAPLGDAAQLLAEHDWPRLYDPQRLACNDVPAAAVIYADDMFVPRAFSEETASQIRGLRAWVTNEYNHDGLRVDGARVLGRLIDMARGRI